MSTRATYEIIEGNNRQSFYIHHDGYPEGARAYFYAAICQTLVLSDSPIHAFHPVRSGLIGAFIRGNDRAELIKDHRDHGDTEYRYTATRDGEGRYLLTVAHRSTSSDQWLITHNGELVAWINDGTAPEDAADWFGFANEGPAVQVKRPEPYMRGYYPPTTRHKAAEIAAGLRVRADRFGAGNPNRPHYLEEAETWGRAAAPETEAHGTTDAENMGAH